MLLLLFLYVICFSFLTWKNFKLGLGGLIILLPAYLIRFNIGPLPSTLLEINILIILAVWLFRYSKNDLPQLKLHWSQQKVFLSLTAIFFLAAIISALTNPLLLKALGIWRAYFLEPILLFIVIYLRREIIEPKKIIQYLLLSTLSISLLAIIQKITGQFFPPSLWDDQLFSRVTAFFTTPNAIGLFLVPILLLSLSQLKNNYFHIVIFTLGLIAIGLSRSDGAWIALGLGLLIYLFLSGYKKISLSLVVIAIIFSLAIPNLRQAITFQDQAGKNRLTIWRYSLEYLTDTPKNFVFGSGLRQFFNTVQKPHYNVKAMERLIYPHNIFLNFWLETGLIGTLSFASILLTLIYFSWALYKKNPPLGASFLAAIIALTIHGLVDVPYFKNDLAALFWIITGLIVITYQNNIADKKLISGR